MGINRTIVTANSVADGYEPFIVEGEPTGQLSLVAGRQNVQAGVATHNWTADPLFRGTWAVPAPGNLARHLDAVEYRDGRLLLAGADIASGSYALIDGAIDTGIRAGRAAAQICAKS